MENNVISNGSEKSPFRVIKKEMSRFARHDAYFN